MIRVYFGKAGSVECVCHEYGDGYPCGPHLCCQHNGQSQSSPCVITRTRATWDAIRAAHIKKCELDRLTNANCGVTV
jgi:hypothetical protein